MPRARRNLVDGGYYHVLTRGNNRRELFKDVQDHGIFLNLIDKYLSSFNISIYHYCLMVNHVHLLLHLSSGPELPKFMQGILQSYASYFRKKYDSVGYVFQNRYKSIYIHSEIYLLEAARYIERNPLRSHMTDDLDRYAWSSYHHYASGKADKIIRNTHPSYFELGKNPDECRSRYREFIRIERPYDRIVDEVYKMV